MKLAIMSLRFNERIMERLKLKECTPYKQVVQYMRQFPEDTCFTYNAITYSEGIRKDHTIFHKGWSHILGWGGTKREMNTLLEWLFNTEMVEKISSLPDEHFGCDKIQLRKLYHDIAQDGLLYPIFDESCGDDYEDKGGTYTWIGIQDINLYYFDKEGYQNELRIPKYI